MAVQQLLGLRRGLAILDLLAGHSDGVAFNRLSDLSGLPAPTLSRVLKVLADERMIVRNGTYALGDGFRCLARKALGNVDRGALLQPLLDRLGRATGQSAAYFEVDKQGLVLKAKAEQAESWHYASVGNHNKRITRNGFGQVGLAILGTGVRDRLIGKADEPPRVSAAAFGRRLATIAAQGFYFEPGEANPSLMRFVAPVFMSDDRAGTVGITMIKRRLSAAEKKRLRAAVTEAAREAARMVRV